MIEARDLTRRYGELVALDGVSTTIARGEVVGLLGHNGAGKTTMMKVLTGFLEPSSGQVTVNGLNVVDDRESVQQRIGYLPESAPLYPEMTVGDYLVLMAGLRGVPEAECDAAVSDAAQETGLLDRMSQVIGTLSRGYRQRVGLAQALVHGPSVLVLDEPTSGLDPAQIASIRRLIRRLGEHQDTTILLSTHILQEVEAVCDRVLVLIGGRLVADAPIRELLASPTIRLSLARGTDGVADGLAGVEGVESAEIEGADDQLDGFERWTVRCVPGSQPSPAIAQVVAEKGWTMGALAPEQRTLEGVFRELEQQAAREASP